MPEQTMRECQEELKEEGYDEREAKNICRKKRGFKTNEHNFFLC